MSVLREWRRKDWSKKIILLGVEPLGFPLAMMVLVLAPVQHTFLILYLVYQLVEEMNMKYSLAFVMSGLFTRTGGLGGLHKILKIVTIYEFVEIFDCTDSSIQVQLLMKVDGHRTVFRREGAVETIHKYDYLKFSHQVPCFCLTNEKGGKLRGCLELDPLSMQKGSLVSNSR